MRSARSQKNRCSRRHWLQAAGGLSVSALLPRTSSPSLPSLAAEPATGNPGFGRAKSVILVFASGGQSQLETWDPKPLAPREIRGDFESIATAIPGAAFCEHLPQLARLANRLTVVRSMSHEDLDHGSAFYLTMTGRYHQRRSGNPPPTPVDFPGYGALLNHLRPSQGFVQTAVHINGPAEVPNILGPGQFGGFLGKKHDPFTLGDVSRGEITVPGLQPSPDLESGRLNARRTLLAAVDELQSVAPYDSFRAKDDFYAQAFALIADPRTQTAFELEHEPAALRDRYGRSRAGQGCLLARRLVEAGCPFVTVFWSHNNRGQDHHPEDPDAWGWDTHNDIFQGLKHYLLPPFDRGVSALIEDLEERGLLDETLVVILGEFGRAPVVALEPRFAGASPGRKHWSWCYSVALTGAGVARGKILGASDAQGAYPVQEAYGPWDLMATIFHALGVDPHQFYQRADGQLLRLTEGRVIEGVYG